ncbi:hypothetical protein SDC9_149040 [bioreactor metagenome]|uniref:Uncharacterized protein n=1 Tax=bioreactor metagenome TaxID=1076179 RepID=A0A645EII4_9ZZZZ
MGDLAEFERDRIEVDPLVTALLSEPEGGFPGIFDVAIDGEAVFPTLRRAPRQGEFRRIQEYSVKTALRTAVPEIISLRIESGFRFDFDRFAENLFNDEYAASRDLDSCTEVADRRREHLVENHDLILAIGDGMLRSPEMNALPLFVQLRSLEKQLQGRARPVAFEIPAQPVGLVSWLFHQFSGIDAGKVDSDRSLRALLEKSSRVDGQCAVFSAESNQIGVFRRKDRAVGTTPGPFPIMNGDVVSLP